jgi:peptidoglycan/xylan/chitin deacetylase (PgdA/CDA1 family)
VSTPILPEYYTSLAPFEAEFRRGLPILTYHHIAPPRRKARIKGLYVQPRLFERQLSELRRAGFASAGLDAFSSRRSDGALPPGKAGSNPVEGETAGHPVVITFDDGFRDVLEHGLPLLQRHGCTGIVFLVARLLGGSNEWQQRAGDVPESLMSEAEVRAWLAAGQFIGSHTLTHPRLPRIPLEEAREEISASRKALEDRFGRAVRHFCYPYGEYNERVRELAVEAGYETACTTVSGINLPGADPFTLKRFTARYASRNWKNLRFALRRMFAGH